MGVRRAPPLRTWEGDGLCLVRTGTVWFTLTPAFLLGVWTLGVCSAGVPVKTLPVRTRSHGSVTSFPGRQQFTRRDSLLLAELNLSWVSDSPGTGPLEAFA